MANKYDLKTWNGVALSSTATGGATGTNIGSGKIASGKTRFLTHIRVVRKNTTVGSAMTGAKVRIGSTATSAPSTGNLVPASGMKMRVAMPSVASVNDGANVVAVADIEGSLEHPILSVGGGGCMGLTVSGSAVDVFAQYFDE